MKIIDLTHNVAPDMPVYPGTEPPVFTMSSSIEETGFLERKISIYSHTGTHVDAPAHFLKDCPTLDRLPIGQFYGSALVLDFEKSVSATIDIPELKPYAPIIKDVDFLLVHTGWSGHWGSDSYFSGYKVLSLEAADWLGHYHLKGVGFDTISADSADTADFPIHKSLLNNNMLIIENLTNLPALVGTSFHFSCFPLKLVDADASPVRAVGYLFV